MEGAATAAVEKLWLKLLTHFVQSPSQETQSQTHGEANNTRYHGSGAFNHFIHENTGGLRDAKH